MAEPPACLQSSCRLHRAPLQLPWRWQLASSLLETSLATAAGLVVDYRLGVFAQPGQLNVSKYAAHWVASVLLAPAWAAWAGRGYWQQYQLLLLELQQAPGGVASSSLSGAAAGALQAAAPRGHQGARARRGGGRWAFLLQGPEAAQRPTLQPRGACCSAPL